MEHADLVQVGDQHRNGGRDNEVVRRVGEDAQPDVAVAKIQQTVDDPAEHGSEPGRVHRREQRRGNQECQPGTQRLQEEPEEKRAKDELLKHRSEDDVAKRRPRETAARKLPRQGLQAIGDCETYGPCIRSGDERDDADDRKQDFGG
jgi:hypothetical protein